jgi:type IV pilus assembly protein PilF
MRSCLAALCVAAAFAAAAPVLAQDMNRGPGNYTPSGDRPTASDETDALKRARIRLDLAAAYFAQGQLTTALDEVKLALTASRPTSTTSGFSPFSASCPQAASMSSPRGVRR